MKQKIVLACTLLLFFDNPAHAGMFSELLRKMFGTCFGISTPLQNQFIEGLAVYQEHGSITQLLRHIYTTEKRRASPQEYRLIEDWILNGADIEERDPSWNLSPILIAFQARDLPVIQLLHSHGANIWAKNGQFGNINYIRSEEDMYAIARATKSITLFVSFIVLRESRPFMDDEFILLEELIIDGASVLEKDADGKTARELAEKTKDKKLINFLKAYELADAPRAH